MRRLRLLLLLTAAMLLALGASCVYNPEEDGYQVVWEDQFDTLDTSVWNTTPYGGSLPATVSNGVMTVTARPTAGTWGHVTTLGQRQPTGTEPSYPDALSWQEGYFEARIRYESNDWAWPAFWLFSMAKAEAWWGENCEVLTAEWDIFENRTWSGAPTTDHDYSTALHRNTSDGTTDGYCGILDTQKTWSAQFPDIDLSEWHVWGGRWNGDQLCTYLDGVQLHCETHYPDSTPQPMHLNFTMDFLNSCTGCGPMPETLTLDVDWVRVWQK